MADKYVDSTLTTGLNDGTSIANAWQSLETVMRNTIASGSYAAGDIIHIRTHDGTSDITEVTTATAWTCNYNVTGTFDDPIIFLADAGIKWVGDSGTFTLDKPGDNANLTFVGGAIFQGVDKNFVLHASNVGTYTRIFQMSDIAATLQFDDMEFTNVATSKGGEFRVMSTGSVLTISNSNIFHQCRYSDWGMFTTDAAGARVNILGCTIDADGLGVDLGGVTSAGSYGSNVKIAGCTVINGAAGKHLFVKGPTNSVTTRACIVEIQSTQMDGCESFGGGFESIFNTSNKTPGDYIAMSNVNKNCSSSFELNTPIGIIEWDEEGNYPTLDAILPDSSSTPWSIKALPGIHSNRSQPLLINNMMKYWNGVSGALDIKVELLIKDTSGAGSGAYDNLTERDCWMSVTYVKSSDGLVTTEMTPRTTNVLTTSYAGWSSTSYGSASYDKYKLELSTSHSVQADTIVSVIVMFATTAGTDQDFFFVNGEIGLELS